MRNLIFSEAWLIGLTSQRLWQIMQEKIIDNSRKAWEQRTTALTWFGARYPSWIPPDPCMVSLLLEMSLAALTAALHSFPQHAQSLSLILISNISSPRRMPDKPRAFRSMNGFPRIINNKRCIFLFSFSHSRKVFMTHTEGPVTSSSACLKSLAAVISK